VKVERNQARGSVGCWAVEQICKGKIRLSLGQQAHGRKLRYWELARWDFFKAGWEMRGANEGELGASGKLVGSLQQAARAADGGGGR
jgi:hypothetical protein